MQPPWITCAMGLCISLPGNPPPTARGTSAKAVVSAVIRMGFSRSSEPCITLINLEYPSCCKSLSRNQEYPVACGNTKREMNPMIAGILMMPLVKKRINTLNKCQWEV